MADFPKWLGVSQASNMVSTIIHPLHTHTSRLYGTTIGEITHMVLFSMFTGLAIFSIPKTSVWTKFCKLDVLSGVNKGWASQFGGFAALKIHFEIIRLNK
jgi:hypothetical protein